MLRSSVLEVFGLQGFVKSKNKAVKFSKAQSANISFNFGMAVTLAVLSLVLLMNYIYGVNKYTAAGYEIKSLQKKISVLNEENKKINLKVSEAGSMVSIQNDYLSSSFVPAGTANFLKENQFTFK